MIRQRPPFIIHHFESITSTNDYLKERFEAPEFTVIVADEQTAGRGRRERTWHSTRDEGLYFSVLLRPHQSVQLVSLISAIAVSEALAARGLTGVDVKWPNDVLVRDRKICGILCEGAGSSASSARVVAGIGINLNHSQFPDELALLATSILIETGGLTDRMTILDEVLDRLLDWYRVLASGGDSQIIRRWEELSSYAFGQQVTVITDSVELSGVTQGLSPTGGLVILDQYGKKQTVLAGEVTRTRRSTR